MLTRSEKRPRGATKRLFLLLCVRNTARVSLHGELRNDIDNVNKIEYNRDTKGRKGLQLWQARISISEWILT